MKTSKDGINQVVNAIERFKANEPITLLELSILLKHYYLLSELLVLHGQDDDRYNLIRVDALDDLKELKKIYKSRTAKNWSPKNNL